MKGRLGAMYDISRKENRNKDTILEVIRLWTRGGAAAQREATLKGVCGFFREAHVGLEPRECLKFPAVSVGLQWSAEGQRAKCRKSQANEKPANRKFAHVRKGPGSGSLGIPDKGRKRDSARRHRVVSRLRTAKIVCGSAKTGRVELRVEEPLIGTGQNYSGYCSQRLCSMETSGWRCGDAHPLLVCHFIQSISPMPSVLHV